MRQLIRAESCISDLVLDEWLAAELEPATADRVERHVAACERCRARRDAELRERHEFLERAPNWAAHAARAGRRPTPRRTDGTRRLAAVAALAAAAGVLLWLAPLAVVPSGTRSKGGARIGFFVKRGERVTRGESGAAVRQGDLLRFTYSCDRTRYFALLNVDARGAGVYFPKGDQATAIAPGNDIALDFSVELDDAPGSERVLGLFCDAPFALEPVRAAVESDAGMQAPAGCELDAITLRKEPAR